MYHLPLFEAPNALAEALITGREHLFVSHFMLQQAYRTEAIDEEALAHYARKLAAPGGRRAGIEYFRAHWVDAEDNRKNAEEKLAMPVMTVGGTASFGAGLEAQVRPLVQNLKHVMIDECGHYLAEEQPERVVAELLGFFGAP